MWKEKGFGQKEMVFFCQFSFKDSRWESKRERRARERERREQPILSRLLHELGQIELERDGFFYVNSHSKIDGRARETGEREREREREKRTTDFIPITP